MLSNFSLQYFRPFYTLDFYPSDEGAPPKTWISCRINKQSLVLDRDSKGGLWPWTTPRSRSHPGYQWEGGWGARNGACLLQSSDEWLLLRRGSGTYYCATGFQIIPYVFGRDGITFLWLPFLSQNVTFPNYPCPHCHMSHYINKKFVMSYFFPPPLVTNSGTSFSPRRDIAYGMPLYID